MCFESLQLQLSYLKLTDVITMFPQFVVNVDGGADGDANVTFIDPETQQMIFQDYSHNTPICLN